MTSTPRAASPQHCPPGRLFGDVASPYVLWALLVLLCLFFSWFMVTHEVWEDFLITLRHSRNAAEGNGLVYQLGERVHGFTSPINVLLPAGILRLFPDWEPVQVLALYNVVALACLGLGVFPLLRALSRETPASRVPAVLLFALLLGLNSKLCSFSMNGQEAAFTLCFLCPLLACFVSPPARLWPLLGVSLGGLMWTRPDGFVAWGAASAALVFLRRGEFRALLPQLLLGGLLGAVLYAPWLAWATWYYGTPLPHTILAKNQLNLKPEILLDTGPRSYLESLWTVAQLVLTPSYSETGGWPRPYLGALSVAAIVACACWPFPFLSRHIRAFSLVAFLCLLYVAYIEYKGRAFPWYFVGCGLAVSLVLSLLATSLFASPRRLVRGLGTAGTLLLVGLLGFGFLSHMGSIRNRQIHVEEGIRKPIGLWLRERVHEGERVYLEPIGYIGYYSGARLLDYPGLVSPEVVAAARHHKAGFISLIPLLRPEWLVLREQEATLVSQKSDCLAAYTLRARFRLSEEGLRLALEDPTFALRADNSFLIYRRKE